MTQGPEESLILACVSAADPPPTDRVRDLLAAPLDWDRVIDLATGQAVIPLVQRALAGVPDRVPAPVLSGLAAESRAVARESLGLTRALLELVDALGHA